jgi:hypothetical protein
MFQQNPYNSTGSLTFSRGFKRLPTSGTTAGSLSLSTPKYTHRSSTSCSEGGARASRSASSRSPSIRCAPGGEGYKAIA